MQHPRFRSLARALLAAVFVLSLTALSLSSCKPAGDDGSPAADLDDPDTRAAYEEDLNTWRAQRMSSLTSDDGWLTLAGLPWLDEGPNAVGSALSSPVRLPPSAPDRLGVLERNGQAVMLRLDPGADVRVEPESAAEQLAESEDRTLLMVKDVDGDPTVVHVGDVSFQVIQRDDKIGVRIKDAASPVRTRFTGIEYFPIAPDWRVTARFEPYSPPKDIPIVNVLGQTTPNPAPGALVFEHDGRTYRLDALDAEDELFVIFGDRTNGEGSYPAGRYLYADKPAEGETTVELDFNRAYNPPCAFTEFATCPLPPPQNKLDVAVEAGEKYAGHPDDATEG
jgi:uncharacterized protein